MKMLIAKTPEPIAGKEEYSTIPKRSRGKPTSMSINAKKIANA